MFLHILPLALLALTIPSAQKPETSWISVSRNPLYSISGIAVLDKLEDQISFVVVHDNKDKSGPIGPRVGIFKINRCKAWTYTELDWTDQANRPIDLEAIAEIPNGISGKHEFLAMTSLGKVFYLRVNDAEKLEVKGSPFELRDHIKKVPDGVVLDDFEALELHTEGKSLFILWAKRGQGGKAVIFWRELSLDKGTWKIKPSDSSTVIPAPARETFKEPVNIAKVRAISDLRVESGTGEVFVSSAYDEGDQGPFSSIIRTIGLFKGGEFKEKIQEPLRADPHLKIEAITFVDDKLAIATDDEYFGALFYLDLGIFEKSQKPSSSKP